jgi:Protein of unknown function (DUF3592)
MKLGPWQVRPTEWQLGVLRIVLIGLMLVGGGLVGLGTKVLVDNQRFVAKAAGATGVVLYVREEVRRERVGTGSNERYEDVSYFSPVVRFLTARGQVVEFQGNDGSLRAGDAVRVLYDPANPQDARLDSWPNRWGAGSVPLAIGLALIAVGAVPYRLLRPAGAGSSTGHSSTNTAYRLGWLVAGDVAEYPTTGTKALKVGPGRRRRAEELALNPSSLPPRAAVGLRPLPTRQVVTREGLTYPTRELVTVAAKPEPTSSSPAVPLRAPSSGSQRSPTDNSSQDLGRELR